MSRGELLRAMQVGRDRLESALSGLRDEDLLAPDLDGGWSVKDLLAYLAFWQKHVVDIYLGLVIGDLSGLEEDDLSVDELNALVYERNRPTALAQVRENESWAYRALRQLAAAAPEEHLFEPQRFAWTKGRPFVDWIAGNTYEHYDEHLPALWVWRERHLG